MHIGNTIRAKIKYVIYSFASNGLKQVKMLRCFLILPDITLILTIVANTLVYEPIFYSFEKNGFK